MAVIKDLIGQTFSKLLVTSYSHKSDKGDHFWNCKCSCGSDKVIRSSVLKRALKGQNISCGCIKRSNGINKRGCSIDLSGKKVSALTIIDYGYDIGGGKLGWKCICDCGKIVYVRSSLLIKNKEISCGCLKSMFISQKLKKHNGKGTSEYESWMKMKHRCYNKNYEHYHRYGGRGIEVCNGYLHSFQNFIYDLGNKPTNNYSIDRIDNDMNYSCGKCDQCIENGWGLNCKWSTQKEQANNTSNNRWLVYNGIKKTATEWSEILKTKNLDKKLKIRPFNDIVSKFSIKNNVDLSYLIAPKIY